MKEIHGSSNLRKTKRNFNESQGNHLCVRNRQPSEEQISKNEPKANFIKINRNKLPVDFFPRTESLRKKPSLNRPSLGEERRFHRDFMKKAESQRNDISPQKTSFFGFFSENQMPGKNHANTLNLKRKFESREEPKRQKIILQKRKFTPMAGIHRGDLLNLFPVSYDNQLSESIILSARNRGIPIHFPSDEPVPRRTNKFQLNQLLVDTNIKKQSVQQEDIGNITFFNSKSNCLPPINLNKN